MMLRPLIIVWVALLILLGLSASLSFVLTGPPSLLASMFIALAKAALIYWFYMHLREQSGLNRIFALGVASWIVIMTVLMGADYLTRAGS